MKESDFVIIGGGPGGIAAAIKAAEAGVKLTPAGSTYPLKKDPRDNNIRIAPTFASVDDVRSAVEVLAICTQVVAIDQLLA